MGYKDITTAGVQRAILEFDKLGRDEFLRAYGFRKARDYFVVWDRKYYDSKAIVGAAHRYDFGVPLGFNDFGGGDRTVRPVLEKLGFKVTPSHPSNPDWVRDELIVALDFYFRHRSRVPAQTSNLIGVLSNQIRLVAEGLGLEGGVTFRNRNGVYMKLMNFRRYDPEFQRAGTVGLAAGNGQEAALWDEFASDRKRLSEQANLVLEATQCLPPNPPSTDDIATAMEGAIVTRLHVFRERDRKLVAKKKADVMKTRGRLECECCGFDFAVRYGKRGEGFLECHHLKPLGLLVKAEKTSLSDLALLCANCHRMIHASAPWLSLEDLKGILGAEGAR